MWYQAKKELKPFLTILGTLMRAGSESRFQQFVLLLQYF